MHKKTFAKQELFWAVLRRMQLSNDFMDDLRVLADLFDAVQTSNNFELSD